MGEVYAGRYELIDLLGEGASGAVWRVWDRRQRRHVAAKLLRQRDAEGLLRFVREQSLRVVNPHVVPPIGWAAEDHDVLLTMDLVNGGTVAQLLEDYGALPVPFAAQLVDQLLDALAAVHETGLVHRDIKPGNLLLEPTGDGPPFLRLGDFGVATILGKPRLTDVGMVLGTPGYVAPEIWLGAEPDPRQDLFAVGVVARMLLTGQRPPATGPLPMDEHPANVPDPLWWWVRQLTDHRPDHRLPTAEHARAALRSAISHSGIFDPARAAQHPEDRRRIVVPDRVGPVPAGWRPTEPANQPDTAEPPTQVSGQPARAPRPAAPDAGPPWAAPPAPPVPAPAGWPPGPATVAAPPPAATVAVTQVHQPQAPYHPPDIPPAPSGLGSSEGGADRPAEPRFGARPILRLVVATVLVAAAVIAFWLAATT